MMSADAFKQEIKLKLTGDGIVELELDDSTIDKVIQSGLREIQRYYCSTRLATIPYSKCIDLSTVKDQNGDAIKVSSVAKIFRTDGYATTDSAGSTDPMQVAQWQLLSGTGNIYNFQNYMYNYMSWNTLLQIRNTTSTDLAFRFDKASNKLYINIASNLPQHVTIDYVPELSSVEDIESDYWIDLTMQLCIALTKVIVGRVRTKYTQTGALWTLDGSTILAEGQEELKSVREHLKNNTQLMYPID